MNRPRKRWVVAYVFFAALLIGGCVIAIASGLETQRGQVGLGLTVIGGLFYLIAGRVILHKADKRRR